jgi:hypothetical protein
MKPRFPFLDENGNMIMSPDMPIGDQMSMPEEDPALNPGSMARVPTRAEIDALRQMEQPTAEPTPALAAPAPRARPMLSEQEMTITDDSKVAGEAAAPSLDQTTDKVLAMDDELRQAQERRQDAMRSANMDRGLDYLLKGYAASKGGQFDIDEAGYKAKLDQAQLPVAEVDERLKNKQTKMKISSEELALADSKSLNDPNSSVSKAYRDFARSLGAKIEDSVPASQLETLRPLIERQAMLEESRMTRAESRADRAMDRDLKMREMELKAMSDAAKGKAESPFEKKRMEELGKSGAEWLSKDRDQFLNNASKIDTAINILNKKGSTTGGITSYTGKLSRDMFNQDAAKAEEAMQSAITETLRPTLGAQFTENEGKRIMDLTFNPRLGDAENARRARELKKFIEKKVEATDALYQHIEETGSVRGFDFSKYGMRPAGSIPSSTQGNEKQIVKRQYSASRNQTRITYSDGSTELLDGKQ